MKKIFITLCVFCAFVGYTNAQLPTQQPYPAMPNALSNISAVEYFAGNTDPGIGSATSLSIVSGTDVSANNVAINFPVLDDGIQFINLRTKDAAGNWSLTNFKIFVVGGFAYSAAPALSNITQAELFIGNTDPGIGNATPLAMPTPSPDISTTNSTINFTAQPDGVNFFNIRTKDANGKWSLTNFKLFFVGGFGYPTASSTASNIVKAEVYVGTADPGFGNATSLPIPNGTDVNSGNVSVTLPALANGNQSIFVRSLDAQGKWSITNFKDFVVGIFCYPLAPTAAPNLANLEYYVDADPGFGNGTAITVTGTTNDVQLTNIPISIAGSLSNGNHIFHIRSKQNPWSIDNAVTFTVGVVVPLTWSYVTAQLQNDVTLVSWGTEQEINTSKFEVEHSIDGLRFTKVGEQLAAGNSTSLHRYAFIHTRPTIGFNFYRIKQIDIDGRFSYSVIVKVLYSKNIKEAFIAPNPVAAMLNLIEPATTFIQTIEVYDSKGSIVLRKNINNDVQLYSLPVDNLPSGNYVLKVNYKNAVKSIVFVK